MSKILWLIGNTTVRTPYRLKEALHILKNSEFHGNLVGIKLEEGFAKLLHESDILKSSRMEKNQNEKGTGDLGRKWRSAMSQLGFVVKPLTRNLKHPIDPKLNDYIKGFPELTGRPYEITSNGQRLIRAENTAEVQECFLRALSAYRIPSIFEKRYKCPPFSPLRFVLQILLHLKRSHEETVIKFEEMALLVQMRTPASGIENVISEILSYRKERNIAKNKRQFYNKRLKDTSDESRIKITTLPDYSDSNFRYLKATGLFQSISDGITLLPEKLKLIELLISESVGLNDDHEYVNNLWKGARLPTDDRNKTIDIIQNLFRQLGKYGEMPGIFDIAAQSDKELSQIRYKLEERLWRRKEIIYAEEQAILWEKIAESMKTFRKSQRKVFFPDGETFNIRPIETSVYFEWIIWRAFLAINSLTNKPWESRKFKVDQDFFPLSHAPAGGPDMLFEFEEFVLVVEVTLTSSSRQEAVEGEPVRRHVAEIAEKFENLGKKVFCMFISLNINSNTAETFKIGNWYNRDDSKLPLQIVPVTLDDFIELFIAIFKSGRPDPMKIRQLLVECRGLSNADAPKWKEAISAEIKRFVRNANKEYS